MSSKQLHKLQAGFTVVELMIASAVFATILLLCTYGLIQVGRVYYKGITQARTQEVARNILEDISQSIQFSGGNVTPTSGTPATPFVICVGSKRYTAILNLRYSDAASIDSTQAHHVLVSDIVPSGCDGSTAIVPGFNGRGLADGLDQAREYMAPNMRLAALVVEPVEPAPNPLRLYRIRVKVISGENDLLDPTQSECQSARGGVLTYRGTEFCAVSELQTVVQQRVKPGL